VRVDFLYDKLSTKTQAIINIVGTIIFLLPFTLLIIYGSYDYFMDSYSIGETSGDPGGLQYLWAIKAMIPISFILLFLEGLVYIIQNINIYRELEEPKKLDPQGALS
jgi:TRAP-type mannitol/chloroaromatic compound transport system permease small subunit